MTDFPFGLLSGPSKSGSLPSVNSDWLSSSSFGYPLTCSPVTSDYL